jgi:hypothetical protein
MEQRRPVAMVSLRQGMLVVVVVRPVVVVVMVVVVLGPVQQPVADQIHH